MRPRTYNADSSHVLRASEQARSPRSRFLWNQKCSKLNVGLSRYCLDEDDNHIKPM